MSLLRKNPLFLHVALAGLIWVLAAEFRGVRFLWHNGSYLWEGDWSYELLIFQTVRDIFNILDYWIFATLDQTMVPDFADSAYFLGILLSIGALFGVAFGVAGWLLGLLLSLVSRLFRRSWHGIAWCFGFQLSVLAFALLKRTPGLYFTEKLLLENVVGFVCAFAIVSALITLLSRWILNILSNDSIFQRAGVIASVPLLICSLFSYPALNPRTHSLGGIELEMPLNPPAIKYILLITVDTLRYDHTSVGHYFRDTTPALSQLAREGITFDCCYSASPWTLPSMMSLITGISPAAHGVEDRSPGLAHGVPTLAEILKNYGYRTAAFYTYIYISSAYGFHRGYDDYEEFDVIEKGKQPVAREVNEKVFPWLDENYQAPFFLAIHYFDPHWPYDPPAPYDALYYPNYDGPLTRKSDDFKPYMIGEKKLSPRDLKYFMALYDGEIRYTDDQLSQLFEKLKSLGIYEDTLIILTADHGEEFMDHEGLGHGYTVYQELIHVPLIIRFPKKYSSLLPRSSRVKRPVTLTDIAPTILDALELPQYDGYKGFSLVNKKIAEDEWNSRMIFSKTDRRYCHSICMIKDGVKFIHSYFPGDTLYPRNRGEGLYILATDPQEKNNLADKNKQDVKTMRGYIFDWIKSERKLRKIYASKEEPVLFDEATKKSLESLGYIK